MRLAALVLALLMPISGQSVSQDKRPEDLRKLQVNVMRLLNTVALRYALAHDQNFPTWQEVAESGLIEAQAQESAGPKMFADAVAALRLKDSTPFEGHELRWTVSADRRHYDITLQRLSGKQCEPTWFTNERGVIYQAVPLDCRMTAKPVAR
jgi:hypothetical protein